MAVSNQSSALDEYAAQCSALQTETAGRKRLRALFDEGSFVETDVFAFSSGTQVSAVTGYGTVNGGMVYAFAQDSTVQGGAVTDAQVQKIAKIYDMAEKTGCPVVAIYDSLGGKIDDNSALLNAYGVLTNKVNRLSGVVPQISLVMGVCSCSNAVAALGADIVIMKQDAELFMNSPYVLSAKNEDALGVGTAQTAAKTGTVHLVCETEEQVLQQTRKLLAYLPENNLSPSALFDFEPSEQAKLSDHLCQEDADAYDVRQIIDGITDTGSFTELSMQWAGAVATGFAAIAGKSVGVVASDAKESPVFTKEECAKISRFVRLCDSYSIPVITLLNTEGYAVTSAQEAAGAVRQAAMLAHSYAEATTVKIAVVIKNAIGPVYTALAGKGAGCDFAFAWPGAVISALPAQTAAQIIYGGEFDNALTPQQNDNQHVQTYISEHASAYCAAKSGLVDAVILPGDTRSRLISALDVLLGKRMVRLPKKQGNIQI